MTSIFVSHTKGNADCAEQLRQELEAHGYTVWREPTSLTIESITYPRTIENVILGSAAVVLVWSSSAAQSEWVERHILSAQSLKKPNFPVILDGTSLPNTLVSVTPVTSQPPCTDAVASLMALPNFPTPQSTDPLIKLSEQAAHEFIRERKAAIDQGAEMLKRGEQREPVLALLEYLARNDIMMGVREKAQEVIDNDAKKITAPPLLHPGDSRHIFGVRWRKGACVMIATSGVKHNRRGRIHRVRRGCRTRWERISTRGVCPRRIILMTRRERGRIARAWEWIEFGGRDECGPSAGSLYWDNRLRASCPLVTDILRT